VNLQQKAKHMKMCKCDDEVNAVLLSDVLLAAQKLKKWKPYYTQKKRKPHHVTCDECQEKFVIIYIKDIAATVPYQLCQSCLYNEVFGGERK